MYRIEIKHGDSIVRKEFLNYKDALESIRVYLKDKRDNESIRLIFEEESHESEVIFIE